MYNASEKVFKDKVLDARDHFNFFGDDHELLFVPGYWHPDHGEYIFGNEFQQTGMYENILGFWTKKDMSEKAKVGSKLQLHYNLDEIAKEIEDPKRTIVVSPQSRRQEGIKGLDTMLYFRDKDGNIRIPAEHQSNSAMREQQMHYERLGYDLFEFTINNYGSEQLNTFFEKNNITKSISSNPTINSTLSIHTNGNQARQSIPYKDLHWNTGRLEHGEAGILKANADKFSYETLYFPLTFHVLPDTIHDKKKSYN